MHTESYLHHGHTVYEHRLDVPLDHLRPAGEDNPTIQVFAREVVRKGREDAPYAVFLQIASCRTIAWCSSINEARASRPAWTLRRSPT